RKSRALPEKLFAKYNRVSRGSKVVFNGEEIDDQEKVKRYARWRVLEPYRKSTLNDEALSEKAMLTIVLGVNVATNVTTAAFPSALLTRRNNLTREEIEQTAKKMGYFDEAFPIVRHRRNVRIRLA